MRDTNPNLDCHDKPDAAQKLMVSNESIVFAVMFSVLIVVVKRNFYKYVYLTGKTREPLVMIFYVLAFTTCLLRIIAFSIYAHTNRDDNAGSNTGYEVGNAVDCLASISTLNIGIFQCVSMQDLVIRVRGSIKQYSLISKNERTSVVQEKTETWLRRSWVFALFISSISWVCGFYLVGLESYYYHHNISRQQHVEDLLNYRREQSDIYCAFYILLGVLGVLTNVLLNATMKAHFGESLKDERKVFKWMFTIFTVTYALYAIYLIPTGYYDGLICQTYIRWIILDLIVVLVDIIPILTILYLHMKTYTGTVQPAQDRSKPQKKSRSQIIENQGVINGQPQAANGEGFLMTDGQLNGKTAERSSSLEEWETGEEDIEYEAEQLSSFELYKQMHPQHGEYSNIISRLGTRKFEDEEEVESWF